MVSSNLVFRGVTTLAFVVAFANVAACRGQGEIVADDSGEVDAVAGPDWGTQSMDLRNTMWVNFNEESNRMASLALGDGVYRLNLIQFVDKAVASIEGADGARLMHAMVGRYELRDGYVEFSGPVSSSCPTDFSRIGRTIVDYEIADGSMTLSGGDLVKAIVGTDTFPFVNPIKTGDEYYFVGTGEDDDLTARYMHEWHFGDGGVGITLHGCLSLASGAFMEMSGPGNVISLR